MKLKTLPPCVTVFLVTAGLLAVNGCFARVEEPRREDHMIVEHHGFEDHHEDRFDRDHR